MFPLTATLLLSVVSVGSDAAPPSTSQSVTDVRYFVIVFAAQGEPNVPSNTHAWATFVRLRNLSDGSALISQDTISWLPADYPETFRLVRLATRGHSFSLDDTLWLMHAQKMCVRYWGPGEIDRRLYEAGLKQLERLRTGDIQYQLGEPLQRIPAFFGVGGSVHCLHALTDVIGYQITGFTRGYDAGALVSDLYSKHHTGRPAPPWLWDAVLRRDAAVRSATPIGSPVDLPAIERPTALGTLNAALRSRD
jgi:hypothetical protein